MEKNFLKNKSIFHYIGSALGWIIIFELVGYALGSVSQVNIATWYAFLHKSQLTPPAIVFPIAWSILYAMIALAGWSLWQQRQYVETHKILIIYFIQLILNWMWSPLFFYFHLIHLSFYCLITITLLTFIIILLTWKSFKFSCYMLLPYFLWLIFASYLNGTILVLN